MPEQLENVSHDYIRYANCWEDADILLKGLEIAKGDRVLSIGSAGDNSFSLLTGNPDLVVAVDINNVQLFIIELKKAAFENLEYDDFLRFLGFKESTDRWNVYLNLRDSLSTEADTHWQRRKQEIENGIIYQGKFEKYFQLFHQKILPLIHSENRIQELFREKTAQEQQQFFILSGIT